ncbi:TetR family transcriptional regulator [Amycolatopsis sp. NBRC 101858]|uniref:TetR/AcrR family transcriptional regulator n=1 Tax=Amycolatopsis sp. NBRC 101858 TaxID=3032200 RepID=UPI0024A25DF1|nr:TetR/AcrR family transcriptional regulator [Amycolatopsis sp. NBRC 101858]GLY42147.1 TetR family transcriptional regulator [Amycolatopsis sp. NBRC 101858]
MSHPNRERADRILDAAGELLLRMGYRKVAVDDIARAVGIGKGTVYLHWRNKELLFQALMMRESADLTDEILGRIRADPAMILPHRMISASFLVTHRRPLVMAMLRGNADMFGSLGDLALRKQQDELRRQFEEAMLRHGLVRSDVPNLTYALNTSTLGFYLGDTLSDEFEGIPLEEKAEVLAYLIRTAFEPAGEPDPRAVAAVAAELGSALEELVSGYRQGIYAHDPTKAPG